MYHFAKRIMPECRCATRNFSGKGGRDLWNKGISKKISSKTPEKQAPKGKKMRFFHLDTLKTTFWMKNLNQRANKQSGPFFQKSGHAKQGKPPVSSLVARLWVWLNIHQYPWISLSIIENAWIYCSDNARALNIHDHLTCSKDF